MYGTLGAADERAPVQAVQDRRLAGAFQNSKPLGEGLFEFKWNDGTRVYYSRTKLGDADIIALLGGDKSSQKRDIPKARKLKDQLEAENHEEELDEKG